MKNISSKPIKKGDDECKKFIIESLNGCATHGFDIDSIYYSNNHWILFEYLKCDSNTVSPYTSTPSNYPYNWKKFYSLHIISELLQADLLLINYSNQEKYKNEVKVMKVLSFDIEKIKNYNQKPYEERPAHLDYMKFEESRYTREEFSNYLKTINKEATLPPWSNKNEI